MSLDYTISNNQQSQSPIPNINNPMGTGLGKRGEGWYRELRNRVEDKNQDLTPDQIDAQITNPTEKYAYEHDIANYGWVTNKDGTRSYEAGMGNRRGASGGTNYGSVSKDPMVQKMYQRELQGANTATQSRTGGQQASQSVFDTSASRYSPAHQNVVNF